jgi:hypothetical protein
MEQLAWTLSHHIGERRVRRGYHLGMPTRRTNQLFLKPQPWQSSDQIEFTQERQKVKAQVTQLLAQNLHPAPSTQQAEQSWLNTRANSKACQSIFLKLTKDKAVKYQSLELVGWYQTVPYLRLESHVR